MPINGEPLNIHLVEDNDDHAELAMEGLRKNRVANAIHHVTGGEQALDFLFRRRSSGDPVSSPRPNLILLDLRLPRIDGLEVLKTIKLHPELLRIPVVILTSSNAETDVARSYDYHASSYIVKPPGFRLFNTPMQDLGFYWLGGNTNPVVD